MWAQGLKLPTQVADGQSTCVCGAEIGIVDMERHVLTGTHGARRQLKNSGLPICRAFPGVTDAVEKVFLHGERKFSEL